jgi:hypothetical protein
MRQSGDILVGSITIYLYLHLFTFLYGHSAKPRFSKSASTRCPRRAKQRHAHGHPRLYRPVGHRVVLGGRQAPDGEIPHRAGARTPRHRSGRVGGGFHVLHFCFLYEYFLSGRARFLYYRHRECGAGQTERAPAHRAPLQALSDLKLFKAACLSLLTSSP